MPARKKDEQINLLPQKGYQSTTSGRVLAWILSTFRIIVIVTEIIVMIAFLSRFWFDAQNTDLNDKIEQKQRVILAARDFELRFKDTQKRLDIYKSLANKSINQTDLHTKVASLTPSDVILTKFLIEGKKVEITAVTPNEKSVQQFIVNLDADSTLKEVGLVKLNTSTENFSLFVFTVEASFNERGSIPGVYSTSC